MVNYSQQHIRADGIDVYFEEVYTHVVSDKTPLVSYCVKCYNQEHLIAAAMRSALNQTCDSMEIVIWDDCSSDASVDVILNEIKSCGASLRFNVRVYKGKKNLGNLGSWIAVSSLANGELLVKADGDDVASFRRAQVLSDAWKKEGKQPVIVSSAAVRIDERDNVIGLCSVTLGGAVSAYRADALKNWPEIAARTLAETCDDAIFVPRLLLCGNYVVVEDRLVGYRVGAGGTNGGKWRARMKKRVIDMISTCKHRLNEFEYVVQRFGTEAGNRYVAGCESYLKLSKYDLGVWSESYSERVRSVLHLPFRMLNLIFLFPCRVQDFIYAVIHGVGIQFRRYKYRHTKLEDLLD